jgi:serine/threonine-protein kinase
MSTGATCPPRDLLRRSLDPDDSLPETERRWIEEHIDRCDRGCKAVIDTLLRGMTMVSGSAPTRAAAVATTAEPPPPPSVPGYEIVGELGRGGMAVVYQARQVALNRLVALKMVRAGAHATAEELGRFRSEAEAVAALRHPNIVQIYEIGAHDGCPYLALEFVDGGSLSERLARERPRPRQAAQLGETLARTVHFAHQQGIIHRDLKPANVLLAADGTPKVADFGLAKRLEGGLDQTRTGQILGTPNYMAPEQAGPGGPPVGTLADVYSLGAILYSMLTGRPPFLGPTPWYVLGQVRSADPAPPRRLAPETPADLETICLKCMEKDPQRRYASAAALADDLRRYLAGEPVQARAIRDWERAWKWIKRRPVVSGLVAALLLAIAAGAVASWVFAAQARAERDRAIAARARTREALDAMVSDVAGNSLTTQKALAPEQRAFLQNILEYYKEFAAEPGEGRQGRERLAAAHVRLGIIRDRLGQREESLAVFRRAGELYAGLAAEFPDVPEYRHEWAFSYTHSGALLADLGKRTDAESAYRTAVAELEKLAADFPAVPNYRSDLARTQNNLAGLLNRLSKRAEAEAAFRAAITLTETLSAEFPNFRDYRHSLAGSQISLGNLLDVLGRPMEAEAAYVAAIAGFEKLSARFPEMPEYRHGLALGQLNLGDMFAGLGRSALAESAYRAAVIVQEKLCSDFPAVPDYSIALGGTYCNIGRLADVQGDATTAIEWYTKGVSRLTPVVAAEPRLASATEFLRNSHWGRARSLMQLKRMGDALSDWQAALQLDDGSGRLDLLTGRADCLTRLGRAAEAVKDASEIAGNPKATAGRVYDCACVFSLASAVPGNPAAATDAAQAILLLRQTVAMGYGDVGHLLADEDLFPLRERADYAALLWTIADGPGSVNRRTAKPPG